MTIFTPNSGFAGRFSYFNDGMKKMTGPVQLISSMACGGFIPPIHHGFWWCLEGGRDSMEQAGQPKPKDDEEDEEIEAEADED